jgi:hypothetical protein
MYLLGRGHFSQYHLHDVVTWGFASRIRCLDKHSDMIVGEAILAVEKQKQTTSEFPKYMIDLGCLILCMPEL